MTKPRAGWVAAAAATLLILIHLATHLDEGGWVAKGFPQATVAIDGHLVQFEWDDVGSTVALLYGDQPPAAINTQNVYRFTGPLLIALLCRPLGSLYAAALAATVLAWAAACWSLYTLARLASGSRAAIAGALLVATGTGFTAFLGNVDAHQFGYAAVAIWLATLEALRPLDPQRPLARGWGRLVLAGAGLCVAGYAMEVAYPLLLFVWLFYGLGALAGLPAQPARAGAVAVRLLLLTAAFALPYFGFRLLVEHILFPQVEAFNDPFIRVRESAALALQRGLAQRLWEWWDLDLKPRWSADWPPAVVFLAAAGAAGSLRRPARLRWTAWALTSILAVLGAVLLTRPLVRTFYLASPGIYLLAACGAGDLSAAAQALAQRFLPRRWGAPRTLSALAGALTLTALLAAVVLQTNADWWGDYRLPVRWFQTQ